ncbi:possible inorganic pyrophosphatase [Weissella oryzae SG25]|uniref:Possible inorganic pyrophosphatase n=1 Tax=Weissella oryzae (strain DSM 25784 / JCM 18191 / LMG 30913 / SG25) TaxID=1329250 RepID=A0A069CV74_WEIOS|nr:HAD family hydrolase [Weissella oryzae]GAK31262.1 possible inorganic pyrophosphatase [Weissella oryzae SG25]
MQTIIFDVDGTLLSTESMYMHSLQHTLAEIGLPKSYAEVYQTFGLPSLDALEFLAIPNAPTVQLKWQQHYHDFWDEVKLFDGVSAMLTGLQAQQFNLGIVTSNTAAEYNDHADAFDINRYFTSFVFAGMTKRMKPFADPIEKALADLATKPTESLYIGDSIHDMQAAHAAGVDFGLAAWGAHDKSKFAEADYIFESPLELLAEVQTKKIIK